MDKSLYSRRSNLVIRLEAAGKAATASKEASLKFLIDAGILDKNGNWASHLR